MKDQIKRIENNSDPFEKLLSPLTTSVTYSYSASNGTASGDNSGITFEEGSPAFVDINLTLDSGWTVSNVNKTETSMPSPITISTFNNTTPVCRVDYNGNTTGLDGFGNFTLTIDFSGAVSNTDSETSPTWTISFTTP